MRDTTERLVAKRVKELRESRGLSRYEFARRAGIAVNQVSRIEGLERAPSITTLARLAQALDVPVGALFEEASPAATPKAPSEITRLTKRLLRLEAGRRQSVLRAIQAVLDACTDP